MGGGGPDFADFCTEIGLQLGGIGTGGRQVDGELEELHALTVTIHVVKHGGVFGIPLRLGIAGNARQSADGFTGLRAVDVPFTVGGTQQEGAVVGVEGLLGIGGQPGAVAYAQGLRGVVAGVVGQAGDAAVIGGVFRGNARGRTRGIGHGTHGLACRQSGEVGQCGFAQIAH